MSAWFENLLTLSIAGSAVVICMLLLRLCFPHAFTAKWQYLLCKTALIFYLFPIVLIIQSFPLSSSEAITSTQSLITDHGIVSLPHNSYLPAEIGLSMFMIWIVGVIIFAGWHTYCYYKFSLTIKRSSFPVPQNSDMIKLVSTYRRKLGITGRVRIAYNYEIDSPVLVGLFKPTILLPRDSNIPGVNLGMVIHHELIHLKRKDLWVKMLVLIAGTIHWFNPFVHKIRKEIHIWSELSCDEEVVKEMSPAERKHYGLTILNLLERATEMPTAFSASLSENGLQLKQRLVRLLNVNKRSRIAVGIALAAIIATGGLGTATAAWAVPYIPAIQSFPLEDTVSTPTQPIVQEEQEKWLSDFTTKVNILEESDQTLQPLEITIVETETKILKQMNLEGQLQSLEEVQFVNVTSEMQEEQFNVNVPSNSIITKKSSSE